MRFTNFILAAGLTASAFAAPVAVQQEDDDSCPIDVEPETTSSTFVAQTTMPASSSVVATSVASSAVVIPSSSAVASSSIQGVSMSSSVVKSSAVAPSSTQVAVASSSSSSSPVTSSASSAAAASTSTASKAASSGKLQWIGANESGAEFGAGNIPGTVGTDYTFPDTAAIKKLMDGGMNIFRIPFLMERMAPGKMTASIDATYLASIKTVVEFITSAGAHAILDAHNFGRYGGSIFTSTSDFGTFWKNLATEFADNDLVIFDCNNEFHDEPTDTIVAELNQACVSAIRSAGATSQYIFVEGTSYTGAWTWTSSGNAAHMANITDPNDKLVYEFHQYLDSDGSGTSSSCVSSTIGAERVADATAWLKANNFKGVLGEYAGGVNSECESAVKGMLDALAADNQHWMGALWWGAGPWWGNYLYAMEPPSGSAYSAYYDTIVSYVA
jgi:endoglucanase